MTKLILTFSAMAASTLPLCAATYTMTVNDGSGKSSLTNWDASGKQLGAPTEANDYVATKQIRAPNNDGSVSFGGNSLGIGVVGGAESVYVPYGGTYTFNRNGLLLNRGRFQQFNALKNTKIAGLVTLKAPAETPFGIYVNTDASKSNQTYEIQATLRGDEGTRLRMYSNAADDATWLYLSPADASQFFGELFLDSQNAAGKRVNCELRGSKTWGGQITVGEFACLRPQYGTVQWSIAKLELKDGAILGGRSGSGTNATITITKNITVGKDIEWCFAAPLYAGNAYDVPFLVKSKDATGELKAENFVEKTTDRITHECLPRGWFKVDEREDGSEVLRFVQPKVVQLKSSDKNVFGEGQVTHSSLDDVASIQDGKLPHDDCDYVMTRTGFAGNDGSKWTGNMFYTPTNCQAGTYSFGGKSLTVGYNVMLKSTAKTFKADCLRLMGMSWFYPRINQSQATVLDGYELFIGPENKDSSGNLCGAYVDVYGNLDWTIKSQLTGSGRVMFRASPSSGKPGGKITLAGLSTNFLGRIAVTANAWDATKLNASVNDCLRVSDARNLGGPLASFTADALVLENWGTLEPTADVDFSTANRGVKIGNFGQIRVPTGKTLTLGNAVTYAGELHKTGDGLLAFGAAAAAGDGATLIVEKGCVQADVAAAFAGVSVSFADGTALFIDATKSLGPNGIDLSGATTSVPVTLAFAAGEVSHRLSAYPLCTVPTGISVDVAKIRGHVLRLAERDNGDGTKTVLADVSRSGLSIFVR